MMLGVPGEKSYRDCPWPRTPGSHYQSGLWAAVFVRGPRSDGKRGVWGFRFSGTCPEREHTPRSILSRRQASGSDHQRAGMIVY